MQYGKVPGVEKPISRLVQGTIMCDTANQEESNALLDGVFELGCNTFDTAHIYGGGANERAVGQWMNSRGIRDKVVLIGKGAHLNADRNRVTPYDITADLHDSLARFKTDYIDLYLLHRDNERVPVGPIVEVLNEHKRAGLIHAFGGSNWSAARIREANDYAEARGLTPFVASSPNFSLAEEVRAPWPGCVSISGPKGAEQRAWYESTQLPLFPWSSLARGFFSGRLNRGNLPAFKEDLCWVSYGCENNLKRLDRVEQLAREKRLTVPQIALAYVLNQPLNIFPLIGCLAVDEFRANAEVLDLQLTPEELAWLDLRAEER